MTARQALREATAAAHEEVDRIFSAFDLADPADYRRFLLAQAAAFLPVEAALDSAGAGNILPDWSERRRGHLLRNDLDRLALSAPAPLPAPAFASPEALLGGVYVLEGSRLGGALLSREVPTDAPKTFLSAKGDSARWRKLLEDLERLLYRSDRVPSALEAATQVFACFAAAGRRQLETVCP